MEHITNDNTKLTLACINVLENYIKSNKDTHNSLLFYLNVLYTRSNKENSIENKIYVYKRIPEEKIDFSSFSDKDSFLDFSRLTVDYSDVKESILKSIADIDKEYGSPMSLEIYEKAIDLKCNSLLADLGHFYKSNHHNFTKSSQKSLQWYIAALQQGDYSVIGHIGDLFENGDSQIPQSHEIAFLCYKTALKRYDQNVKKNMNAALNIGNVYREGQYGVEKNYTKALKWYKKGLMSENTKIQKRADFNIGLLYQKGDKTLEKNFEKAVNHYEKALKEDESTLADFIYLLAILLGKAKLQLNPETAEDYYQKTFLNMGYLYSTGGYGLKKNYSKAVEWYEKAADKGSVDAMLQIGNIYKTGGHEIEKNYIKARNSFEKAIQLGDNSAMNNLGHMYEKGLGVEVNYTKAIELYKKAINLGNQDAINNLKRLEAEMKK